jgi:hypothetical protein
MITNIRLELDDDARRALASLIAGKPVKRLATRAEVCDFVRGSVDALVDGMANDLNLAGAQPKAEVSTASRLSPQEVAGVERLRKQGHNDSYIRGQLQVCRRYGIPL